MKILDADATSRISPLGDRSISVTLGTWGIGEVQLGKMGSKGPRGEYVSEGGIELASSSGSSHSQ